MWAEDYIKLAAEDERWIIEPLLPSEGIINLYGKPKAGKSFAALGMAQAISSGAPDWNGFPIHQHGPVLYVQVDTPRPEWASRFITIKEVGGLDISNIGIVDMKMAPYPANILLPQHVAYMRAQYEAVKPVVVVVDTMREIHEADENNSTDMKRVMNGIISAFRGAAIILVSHSRKDTAYNAMGADSDLMDEGRGSSYISGRMDTIIKFTGKKSKGFMHYKGRSAAENKVAIFQHPETGLVLVDDTSLKQEAEIKRMLGVDPKRATLSMAKELVSMGLFVTTRTAERHIEKIRKV